MTRDAHLAAIEVITENLKAIVRLAQRSCGDTSMKQAAGKMGILAGGKVLPVRNQSAISMVCDLALFETDDRGGVAFNRFLAGPVKTMPEPIQALARQVAGSFFSLFKFAGLHEEAGIWVEDLLAGNRRIWLMESRLEDRENVPDVLCARIFDYGPYHLGLGVMTSTSDEMIRILTTSWNTTGLLPLRRSLAATIYGLSVVEGPAKTPGGLKFMRELSESLTESGLLPATTSPTVR